MNIYVCNASCAQLYNVLFMAIVVCLNILHTILLLQVFFQAEDAYNSKNVQIVDLSHDIVP